MTRLEDLHAAVVATPSWYSVSLAQPVVARLLDVAETAEQYLDTGRGDLDGALDALYLELEMSA